MKVIIISDSHGNIVRLKHVLGFAQEAKMGAIIHCGDWDNPQAVQVFADTEGIPVYGVLGNADIDPKMLKTMDETGIIFEPDFLEVEMDGQKIGVCHFPTGLTDALNSQEYDILLCGHIHSRFEEQVGKTLFVRPGALHRTKEPSFVVYDTDLNKVEFVDLLI